MTTIEQHRARSILHTVFRNVQLGFALLFLGMGGLLLLVLVLSLPTIMHGLLAGNLSALKDLLMASAGCAACWLQWRYRKFVYPRLRPDHSL